MALVRRLYDPTNASIRTFSKKSRGLHAINPLYQNSGRQISGTPRPPPDPSKMLIDFDNRGIYRPKTSKFRLKGLTGRLYPYRRYVLRLALFSLAIPLYVSLWWKYNVIRDNENDIYKKLLSRVSPGNEYVFRESPAVIEARIHKIINRLKDGYLIVPESKTTVVDNTERFEYFKAMTLQSYEEDVNPPYTTNNKDSSGLYSTISSLCSTIGSYIPFYNSTNTNTTTPPSNDDDPLHRIDLTISHQHELLHALLDHCIALYIPHYISIHNNNIIHDYVYILQQYSILLQQYTALLCDDEFINTIKAEYNSLPRHPLYVMCNNKDNIINTIEPYIHILHNIIDILGTEHGIEYYNNCMYNEYNSIYNRIDDIYYNANGGTSYNMVYQCPLSSSATLSTTTTSLPGVIQPVVSDPSQLSSSDLLFDSIQDQITNGHIHNMTISEYNPKTHLIYLTKPCIYNIYMHTLHCIQNWVHNIVLYPFQLIINSENDLTQIMNYIDTSIPIEILPYIGYTNDNTSNSIMNIDDIQLLATKQIKLHHYISSLYNQKAIYDNQKVIDDDNENNANNNDRSANSTNYSYNNDILADVLPSPSPSSPSTDTTPNTATTTSTTSITPPSSSSSIDHDIIYHTIMDKIRSTRHSLSFMDRYIDTDNNSKFYYMNVNLNTIYNNSNDNSSLSIGLIDETPSAIQQQQISH